MPVIPRVRTAACTACVGIATLLAACTSDIPTAVAPAGEPAAAVDLSRRGPLDEFLRGLTSVCHVRGAHSRALLVSDPALPAHLAHGDYITTFRVSHDPDQPTDDSHFRRITDAVAVARAGRVARGELTSAACRITIAVASGTYAGTAATPAPDDLEQFPIVVDVPDITLRGALRMRLDRHGRATGEGFGHGASTLTPSVPLPVVAGVSTPIIIANGHPGGSAGNGLTVRGFVFQSGHDPAVDAGGQGVLSLRVADLTLEGNRFEAGFTESIDLRATNAELLRNHLSGTAGTCDICLAGPGDYRARGNRLLAGGIPGITVDGPVGLPVPAGVEAYTLPATAETFATIVNNEISDHNRLPVGVGIRLDAIGVLGPNVQSTVHATIRDNHLANNRFGIIMHAAFPKAGTLLRGDIDAALHGNVIEQSCQAKLLVSFARHTTTLGLANQPFLNNSTFRISLGGDLDWSEAWYGHPDGFGNTLIVDGQAIPNGTRQFYDPVGCPGLTAPASH